MSLFGKLGKDLGVSNGVDIEDYMNSQEMENVDLWLKNVGPSDELRKWFLHDPDKWDEFKKRYIEELKTNPVFDKLIDIALNTDSITLLYATKDTEKNNAAILLEQLNLRLSKIQKVRG